MDRRQPGMPARRQGTGSWRARAGPSREYPCLRVPGRGVRMIVPWWSARGAVIVPGSHTERRCRSALSVARLPGMVIVDEAGGSLFDLGSTEGLWVTKRITFGQSSRSLGLVPESSREATQHFEGVFPWPQRPMGRGQLLNAGEKDGTQFPERWHESPRKLRGKPGC